MLLACFQLTFIWFIQLWTAVNWVALNMVQLVQKVLGSVIPYNLAVSKSMNYMDHNQEHAKPMVDGVGNSPFVEVWFLSIFYSRLLRLSSIFICYGVSSERFFMFVWNLRISWDVLMCSTCRHLGFLCYSSLNSSCLHSFYLFHLYLLLGCL